MSADYFASFDTIRFDPDATDDLAYRVYDKNRMVMGKSMEEHMRFAVCFWHTFCWGGNDIFGGPTFDRPWLAGANDAAAAKAKREAAFAFVEKLDVPYYTFHDVDVMATAETAHEFQNNFAEAVDHLEELQETHGRKLLWGTANAFGHPRYMAGAATNPDPEIYAWAAMQVQCALDATHRLNGANYVLWGGREGYDSILNTEIGTEMDNLGRFLALVVDHKHRIGFTGTILVEPKPHEPTKHQYDFDTQSVYGFLQRYGLEGEVKVNIEANHATMSGHSFEHEVAVARALGVLGSVDANRGDPQNGWDTDQFPNSPEEWTRTMLEFLRAGGFETGGFNLDAKVRRQSIDAADLFHGHVGAIDVMAQGLLNAAALIEEGTLEEFRAQRYAGWQGELGKLIHAEGTTLADVANHAIAANVSPKGVSGKQEWCENLVNRAAGTR